MLRRAERVRIVVLVDNRRKRSDLATRWGLSLYVEVDGERILFDCGPDPAALRENAIRLGVDLSSVSAVVISHGHGDHTDGLPALPRRVRVYVPDERTGRLVRYWDFDVVVCREPTRVLDSAITTGALGFIREHALAILTRVGTVLLVGCSHPSLPLLMDKARDVTGSAVKVVVGGLHVSGSETEEMRAIVSKLREHDTLALLPLHCTGDDAREIFAELLGDRYFDGTAGTVVEITDCIALLDC